ncbi:MAG: hypothetical protein R8G01_00180 [Ilumatobacteraceae bacterium]|nr:hypothetical protein [Ilumatobacteraceae bacterium]
MTSDNSRSEISRTRWSAIGAAIAITLGGGGIGLAQASSGSGDKPVTVTVDAKRILDTRTALGLAGAFTKDAPRELQVTGEVDVATDTGTATETVVPAGATAVLVNVTVVLPTDQGFLTLREGGAAGSPTTSTVNFQAGSVEPNAATVDLSGDGKLQVWVFMPSGAARADVLVDVVGYTVDHDHDDRYYTEDEVDAAVAAKADSADVYTKAEAAVRFDPVRTLLTWSGEAPVDFSTGAFTFKKVRDVGSFDKVSDDTVIRLDLNTHQRGTGGLFCEYQLRVDGVSADGGVGPDRSAFITGADSDRQALIGTMLFEGLGAGSHDVTLWVRSNSGICEENDGNHARQLQVTEER